MSTRYKSVMFLLTISLLCIGLHAENMRDNFSNEFSNSAISEKPISTSKETIDLTYDNYSEFGNFFANNSNWVNAENEVILSEIEWSLLDQMIVNTQIGEDGTSAVFINFTCNISDKVPGYFGSLVTMRLMRDDEELTSRSVNLQTNTEYYHDMTLALSYTDLPEAGEHEYRIEYKIDAISYRSLATDRNFQIIEISNSRRNK